MASKATTDGALARFAALSDLPASSVSMVKLDRPLSGVFLKKMTLILVRDGIGPAMKLSPMDAVELAMSLITNACATTEMLEAALVHRKGNINNA
jgi:hypothetical protein